MPSFLSWVYGHIAAKLIGGTMLVIAVVLFTANSQTILKEREVFHQQMDSQGNLLANVVSISCIEPLLIQDYPVLETIAELMSKSEADLSFVRVERQDGKVVAEIPAGASDDPLVLAASRTYSSPIKANPKDISPIGRISLGISTQRADDFISERISSLVKDAVVTFAVITVLLVILLRNLVSVPLQRLDNRAADLGRGNLKSPVTLPSKDEIGRLATTLDNMRQELKKSYELITEKNIELSKHSEKLEELVQARTDELLDTNKELRQEIIERKEIEVEHEKIIKDLQLALAEIKTLRGIFPICSFCKKIRDDKGYWNQIESYIRDHSDAEFSHGFCPDCAEKHYSKYIKK